MNNFGILRGAKLQMGNEKKIVVVWILSIKSHNYSYVDSTLNPLTSKPLLFDKLNMLYKERFHLSHSWPTIFWVKI